MPTFAVIDSAFHEGLHRRLDAQGVHYMSLFVGTPEHALTEIAPLLIPLDDISPQTRSLLLRLGRDHPCLSWLNSELAPPALAAQLSRWHTVQLEDGETLVLRWYDTRVQSALMEILDESQRLAFFHSTVRWAFCDRFGQWQMPTLASTPKSPELADAPIELSRAQFSALMEACQPDVVLHHLMKVIPDEIRRCDSQALYALVKAQVHVAARLGWEGLDDQTQFLLPSLYTSGRAAEHPEFRRVMHTPPDQGADGKPLADRMEDLSDAVWSSGPPLWESAPRQDATFHAQGPAEFPDAD